MPSTQTGVLDHSIPQDGSVLIVPAAGDQDDDVLPSMVGPFFVLSFDLSSDVSSSRLFPMSQ